MSVMNGESASASARQRLWAEFLLFFIATPLLVAIALPATLLFPILFGVTFIGLVLLHFTEGFHWRDLGRGWGQIDVRLVLGFGVITFGVGYLVMWLRAPQDLFSVLLARPRMLLMILVLYPLLSALPQEIVFRVLFFRRYGTILPSGISVIVLNAAVFSLAHLMYWSWIVAVMTFAGGIAFGWAYEHKRSFGLAVVLHSVAGGVIFALGMGIYFYSGNVQRPF